MIWKQLNAVLSDLDVEWCKTGMLWSAGGIGVVMKAIKKYGLRAIVDPVMISTSGSTLLREDAMDALLKLLGYAELVTPNIYEASKICGRKISSVQGAEAAAKEIYSLGPKAVLVKGGHLPGKVDVLFDGKKMLKIPGGKITDERIHGAGCSFSAAITAGMARGFTLGDAIHKAKMFIESAIKGRLKVGRGPAAVNPLAELQLSKERGAIIEEVWQAAKTLARMKNFAKLVPEVGSNIAMALPGATSIAEVVGLSGRMVRHGDSVLITGFPEFGGSEHVANFVIAAHKHDWKLRAGMNIRYSKDILAVCRKLGFKMSSFERNREPKGVKTMVWGTELAIKKFGGVPDIIYDEGGIGKEPMIRLLAPSPAKLVEMVKKILKTGKF